MTKSRQTTYARSGNKIFITDITDSLENLPVGTYSLALEPFTNQFYLALVEDFKFPSKLYGQVEERTERMLNTYFLNPTTSLGVLLTGEKGSGKSLLAKHICLKAKEQGISTIIVSAPYYGANFNRFLQNIPENAVVFFDEFEKVYNSDQQEELLTLFDGTFPTNKLFLLTTNSSWSNLANALKNRPGRIHYYLEFKGLTKEEIRDYCEDKLIDKSKTTEVLELTDFFDSFNFDMLRALVAEMNLYGESPKESAKWININIDKSLFYDVVLKIDGVVIDTNLIIPKEIDDPLNNFEIPINIYSDTLRRTIEKRIIFNIEDLTKDSTDKKLTFTTEDDEKVYTLELSLQKEVKRNFNHIYW